MTRKQTTLAKLAVSLVLLAVLFCRIDWRDSLQTILGISVPFIGLLLLISLIMILISCLKWQIFLSSRGTHVPLGRLFLLYLVGYFFNNFAPGSVGGDIVRGLMLGEQIGNRPDSFGSVFLERFTGFMALISTALIASLFSPNILQTRGIVVLLLLMALVLCGTIAFLVSRPLQKVFIHCVGWFPEGRLTRGAKKFLDVVFFFRDKPRVLAKTLLLSFLFHIMTILNTAAACFALHIHYAPFDLAVLVPMILLVSAIPITLNSLGIMEGAFVYFLAMAGIGSADALSIALVLRAKNLLMSMVGGLVLIKWHWVRGQLKGAPQGAMKKTTIVLLLLAAILVLSVFVATTQVDRKMRVEPIELQGDGLMLTGDLYIPGRVRSSTAILFLHGSAREARQLALYPALCKRLCERGYMVCNLDQRGHGQSESPAEILTVKDLGFVADAKLAAQSLVAKTRSRSIRSTVIIGHSFGGGVAVAAGFGNTNTCGVISISPGRRIAERFFGPHRIGGLVYVQKRKSKDLKRTELIPLELIRPMLESYDIGQFRDSKLPKPLLIIEGKHEDSEDLQFTRELVASMDGPIEHVIIDNADHYFGAKVVGQDGSKYWDVVHTNIVDGLANRMDQWLKRDP